MSESDGARIPPGTVRDIGRVNMAIARAVGAAMGAAGPPNVMTTLARHRGLFRRWLRFAGALMPRGRLPRAETELVILRVAHLSGCGYEWHHHERIGVTAGLSAEQIAGVREGPEAGCFSDRERLVLRAVDELHERGELSDSTWEGLRPLYSDAELIELCMLAGHYRMLAGTLNSLRVEHDRFDGGPPPRLARAVQRAAERRSR